MLVSHFESVSMVLAMVDPHYCYCYVVCLWYAMLHVVILSIHVSLVCVQVLWVVPMRMSHYLWRYCVLVDMLVVYDQVHMVVSWMVVYASVIVVVVFVYCSCSCFVRVNVDVDVVHRHVHVIYYPYPMVHTLESRWRQDQNDHFWTTCMIHVNICSATRSTCTSLEAPYHIIHHSLFLSIFSCHYNIKNNKPNQHSPCRFSICNIITTCQLGDGWKISTNRYERYN